MAAQKKTEKDQLSSTETESSYDPSTRILYPTMGGPFFGEIFPVWNRVSLNKEETVFPVGIILCGLKNWMRITRLMFQQETV
ncbi:hypothetical protein HanIR_Chr11g0513581 [Helianthus annuus]|nr:hypothetical protein HanIR_Chr11g0513581 [Helianthus annuus]